MKKLLIGLTLLVSMPSFANTDSSRAALVTSINYSSSSGRNEGYYIIDKKNYSKINRYYKNNIEFEQYGLEMSNLPEKLKKLKNNTTKDIDNELFELKLLGVNKVKTKMTAGLISVRHYTGFGDDYLRREHLCSFKSEISLKDTSFNFTNRLNKVEIFPGNKELVEEAKYYIDKPIVSEKNSTKDFDTIFEGMAQKHICHDVLEGNSEFSFDTPLEDSLQDLIRRLKIRTNAINDLLERMGV